MLPTLSKHAAANSIPDMVDALARTMRMVLFLMVPSMIGLAVLRVPIISVLFERGNFDHRATLATASALLYYSVGLWAFSEVRVVAQAFYALQDTMTPMKIGAFAVVANIVLSLLLMTPMGHNGLALANSLASMLNVGVLVWILRGRVGRLQGRRFLYSLIKILLASTVMGFCAYYAAQSELWSVAGQQFQKAFYLARGLLVGLITYIVMCLILRIEEFRVVRAWIWKPVVTKGS